MGKNDKVVAREEILDAAQRLFMIKGYVNTSMDDIAEAVGLTKGGVYYYVGKKEDLLTGTYDQLINAIFERVDAAVVEEKDSIKRLRKFIKAYISIFDSYHAHLKIIFTEIDNFPKEALGRVGRQREILRNKFKDILSSGISENIIRNDLDCNMIAMSIFGMMNWMYVWYRPSGEKTLDVIADDIFNLMLFGLLAPKNTDVSVRELV